MKSGKCLNLSTYVRSHQSLSISRQYDNISAMFMIATPSEFRSSTQQTVETYSSELSKTRRLETER
jgi:hypothetical protein